MGGRELLKITIFKDGLTKKTNPIKIKKDARNK